MAYPAAAMHRSVDSAALEIVPPPAAAEGAPRGERGTGDVPRQDARRVGIMIEHAPMSHLNMAKLNGVLEHVRAARAWRTRLFSPDAGDAEVAAWRPDGLIVACDRDLTRLRVRGEPVRTVHSYDSEMHGDPFTVAQDEAHIGGGAAAYFLDRGYENFAFVGCAQRGFSRSRDAAYKAALKARGFERVEVDLPRHRRSGVREGRYGPPKGLLDLPTPLAVFAANDAMAMGVLELAGKHGRAVPGEWAVLGVDDIVLMCEFSDPPLSSIVHPQTRVGRAAAEMLDELMRGDEPPAAHLRIASPGVHTRRSTEGIAVADALVGEAVRWMSRRINRPLTVSEAASDLDVSRNTLHRRFVAALGHGMKREHRRQQILRATELLTRTDDALADIAVACGFNDGAHFSRMFRSEVGQTPARYRAEALEQMVSVV